MKKIHNEFETQDFNELTNEDTGGKVAGGLKTAYLSSADMGDWQILKKRNN